MEKYYIMVNGEQQGPFTAKEIINKGFSNDSYIFNKGLGDWKKISEVAGFSSFEKKEVIQTISKPPSTQKPKQKEQKATTQTNKKQKIKFNRKEEEYKPIRITIITLTVINLILESGYAGSIGRSFNPIPVFITYWATLLFVRSIYNKDRDFSNKVLITISIFVGVYLVKMLLVIILLKLIL